MFFLTEDNELFKKYNNIWNKISNIKKEDSDSVKNYVSENKWVYICIQDEELFSKIKLYLE